MNTTDELDAFFDRVPEHVLVVVDQAYFEYIDRPDYPDAVERVPQARSARRRPPHVLEDLRARRAARRLRRRPDRRLRGDGEGAPAVRRDDAGPGGGAREPRRRRRDRPAPGAERGGARPPRGDAPRARPRAAPGAVGNFLYVESAATAPTLYERLLREGVIVRPLHGFGAPTAIRVSVGTPEELDFLAPPSPACSRARDHRRCTRPRCVTAASRFSRASSSAGSSPRLSPRGSATGSRSSRSRSTSTTARTRAGGSARC